MSEQLQAILALWGAGLSTLLGIIEVLKYRRDKPRIVVSADLLFRAIDRETKIKGTLIETDHGPNEALLAITAVNHGWRALQITACVIEESNGNLHQVIPSGLPALLEPNTQIQVEIQKEWIDDVEVVRLGVLDALGRIHAVDRAQVEQLVRRSNALPSNKREYRHRETGEVVKAFQVRDKAVLTKRR